MKKIMNRDFALLLSGNAVSQLGDGAGFIGLMWWVSSRTGSAMLLGAIAVVRTVTNVILGPLGGVVADRFSRKLIIIWMDVVRGISYGLMAYLTLSGRMTTPLLLSLVCVNSAASSFFQPAISSGLPSLVEKADLPRANSLMGMVGLIVQIASYGAGGMMAALIGVPALLLADGISFFVCAAAEVLITIPRIRNAEGEGKRSSLMADLKSGFDYVKDNEVVFRILKIAAVLNFFFAPIFMLLPRFVQNDLGGTSALYGYMMAGMSVGTLLASIVISATKSVERNPWMVIQSLTIQGGLMLAFALAPDGLHTGRIGLLLIMGFFNGIVNIHFMALIQKMTSPEQMGRVFGLLTTVCGILQPISQGLAGALGDRMPLSLMYAVCAVAFCLAGIRFAAVPNLRSYLMTGKEADPEAAPAGN